MAVFGRTVWKRKEKKRKKDPCTLLYLLTLLTYLLTYTYTYVTGVRVCVGR